MSSPDDPDTPNPAPKPKVITGTLALGNQPNKNKRVYGPGVDRTSEEEDTAVDALSDLAFPEDERESRRQRRATRRFMQKIGGVSVSHRGTVRCVEEGEDGEIRLVYELTNPSKPEFSLVMKPAPGEPTAAEIEAALELPEYKLTLRSESITATSRKLSGLWPSPLPEPSAVDRLAAQVDPEARERVSKMDEAIAKADEAVADLRGLWDDDD